MAARWERYLEIETSAGLIEPSTAERVRAYEAGQERTQGLRWPVVFAIGLGGLLLGAGVLLFVAAHWDTLSPGERFGLVLLLVALFHVAGAFAAERFSVLSTTLHAVGTISLGAGIFLAGQIFNLQEHWPGGLMLWALGAWVAYALLRNWPQAALAAVLTPMWLSGEWLVATGSWIGKDKILAEGLLLLAITLSDRAPAGEGNTGTKGVGVDWRAGADSLCVVRDCLWGTQRLASVFAVGHCARVRLDSYTIATISAGLGVEARRFMDQSHRGPLGRRAGYNKPSVSTQRKFVASCLARAGAIRNVRAGFHRTDRLGFDGSTQGADQSGCGGIRSDRSCFLFLQRNGQTRPLGKPDRVGLAVSPGRMAFGENAPPTGRPG